MKRHLLAILVAATAAAQPRTNPPTLLETAPLAIARGQTTEVRIEGINLRGASAVLFDQEGVSGKVLHVNELGEFQQNRTGIGSSIKLGPFPPRNQVTLEVAVAPSAQIGLCRFRLVAREGTSNIGTLSIEPYYGETAEIEPNETIPEAMLQNEYVYLPTIVAGSIRVPGDEDFFAFRARAGQELVFDISAQSIGSALRWAVTLYDSAGARLAGRRIDDARPGTAMAYRFPADGRYTVEVRDLERGGGRRHIYRLKIGEFPYLTGVYPLGVQRGRSTEVGLEGHHLGDERRLAVNGQPSFEQAKVQELAMRGARGWSHNRLRLAVGDYPAVAEQDGGNSRESAQTLAVPSTVNARVSGLHGKAPDQDYYRFRALKGRLYIIDVEAQRFGSPLDSVIEVLDAQGRAIPRATVRAIQATALTLADRDSAGSGIRLVSPDGFAVGDYVMIGNEILRVEALPRTPDDDFRFENVNGQRIGFFDTTPEAHAVDTPAYKVQMHPPGKTFAPNGLPLLTLYFRNDDGGALYGKDSRLHFTAPADGEYFVKIADTRGMQGEQFAYRLTVREPAPDFTLDASPSNPSVPRGGRLALRVAAARLDGFDGPIAVEARDLPAGLRATRNSILPGQDSTVIVLEADENAAISTAVLLHVAGRASIGGREVSRVASADDKLRYLALAEAPDLYLNAEQKEVILEAGGTAEVSVSIRRTKGFDGRVPINVLNLPIGVRVLDFGLNGVMITEEETSRKFVLEAKPWVKPTDYEIALSGEVETHSSIRSNYASAPIRLKIVPGQTAAAGGKPAGARPAGSANQQ